MEQLVAATAHRAPWNKGKLVGQKAPPLSALAAAMTSESMSHLMP
jgi:hypothetical protein